MEHDWHILDIEEQIEVRRTQSWLHADRYELRRTHTPHQTIVVSQQEFDLIRETGHYPVKIDGE